MKTVLLLKVIIYWFIQKDKNTYYEVNITITPTVPHCMFLSIIGLSIRYKVQLEFDKISKLKLNLTVKDGSHKEALESNFNFKVSYKTIKW